jgi:hypothetical protein
MLNFGVRSKPGLTFSLNFLTVMFTKYIFFLQTTNRFLFLLYFSQMPFLIVLRLFLNGLNPQIILSNAAIVVFMYTRRTFDTQNQALARH